MTTITTFSGVTFSPLSPRPEDINIEDIAHALSNLCRFTGHSRFFYSVAEHSVLVSYLTPPALALAGLLHDASEAYLNDIAGPIKHAFPEYVKAEYVLQKMIEKKFDVSSDWPEVEEADKAALLIEQAVIFRSAPKMQLPLGLDLDDDKRTYPAKQLFLKRFTELTQTSTTPLPVRASVVELGPSVDSKTYEFQFQPPSNFPAAQHSTAEALEAMDRHCNTGKQGRLAGSGLETAILTGGR